MSLPTDAQFARLGIPHMDLLVEAAGNNHTPLIKHAESNAADSTTRHVCIHLLG
jgi:hypothetical protein